MAGDALNPSGCGNPHCCTLDAHVGFIRNEPGACCSWQAVLIHLTLTSAASASCSRTTLFPHGDGMAQNVAYYRLQTLKWPHVVKHVEEAGGAREANSPELCRRSGVRQPTRAWRWRAISPSTTRCCCSTSRSGARQDLRLDMGIEVKRLIHELWRYHHPGRMTGRPVVGGYIAVMSREHNRRPVVADRGFYDAPETCSSSSSSGHPALCRAIR